MTGNKNKELVTDSGNVYKLVKVYTCECCGVENSNPRNFRLIAGNVLIPNKGGLIGGNIFSGETEKSEETRKIKIAISDDESLRVYGMMYCIDCYLKASKITSEGENGLE